MPLRVAVLARAVFPLHGYGGLERHVFDLVTHLAARGIQVTLITREPAGAEARDGTHQSGEPLRRIDGVTVQYVPYRTFPLAGRRGTTVLDRSTAYPVFGARAGRCAAGLVEARKIDLVHGLGASALGYALVRRRAGAPLVLNPQGLEEFGATDPSRATLKRLAYFPLQIAVRRTAAGADRVIATDRVLEPAVRNHLRVPAERIRVVPNAVDLDVMDALAGSGDAERVRREAGIAPDELVILSAGRIEQNKGFHVLAEALAGLRSHGLPDGRRWRWVLAGDGPYRRTLERALRDRGLSDRTVVAGRIPDRNLHAWYEAATLFVHPTLYEGSSLVTLEAMAHRRAVVATAAGGLPDKVRPGLNGWLVPPGDPAALTAALSGALTEPARLFTLGEAGRRIVEQEFAWPAVAGRLIEVYQELLPARR